MRNRVHIVTGAGSGLGRQTAIDIAADGAKVVCSDINSEAAEATADRIRNDNGAAISVLADVTNWSDMKNVADVAMSEFGAIDGLFANAGLPGGGSVTEVPLADWERTLSVNLTGAMLAARAVIPAMIEAKSGSILFTASISGLKGFPNQAAYAATKGGVIALARQMSIDLAQHQVRVNALCPGMVVTPLVEELYERRSEYTGVPKAELLSAMADSYPLGRTGRPEEMSAMAKFLLGDSAGWITGQSFSVDGGMTA